jgi:mRNA interferase MazF
MGKDYAGGMGLNCPQRGDVYWINLDPTIGAEIKKTRPCVIISPDAANRSSPLVIIAPITRGNVEKVYFHEIFLPSGTANLQHDSKIKVFQIRCVDKKRLSKSKVGSIPSLNQVVWYGTLLHYGAP